MTETSVKVKINIEGAFSKVAEDFLDETTCREPGDNIDRVVVDWGQQSSITMSYCN